MQDGRKAVWSISYVSVAFFPSLKQNFIVYRSSKVSDCIFEIHQLWQSGFSRVYSNSYFSCSYEPEIIKIGQSSHKMHSNNILNFQESTTILNAHVKMSGNLSYAPRIYIYIYINPRTCKSVHIVYFSDSNRHWRTHPFFFLIQLSTNSNSEFLKYTHSLLWTNRGSIVSFLTNM